MTWLVVGLGNPGARYQATRHNIGFRFVDALAEGRSAAWRERFSGLCCQIELAGERVYLLKPQTFMNKSGLSARPLADFYKIEPGRLVVVHDELDLGFGQLKLKKGGGEGGHNGLRSISQQFKSQDYLRLRMGIGRPPAEFSGTPADFVLSAFAPAEAALLDEWLERGAAAVTLLVRSGLASAMNEVNRRH